ncbi:DUF1015 domain-containing protein [Anaerocolumna sp. MB42-C2]|uniref:DUF1015 domain-containing protein n=1 Tax=Anaerocolumna sp. MB42-C2 TaxID=3070997 RepID=UPI0027E0B882|nr:DUF1015 family protein [Anaerocolumna sp. MB42-C2]WMJ88702.1 DUF1015 family protein [Anaerocolumna sp. MB42-C2]
MADVKPFQCIRPKREVAGRIAALPYDVYNREEAKKEIQIEPLSFLRIDRPETQFEDSVDTYDDRVYDMARELLEGMIADGSFVTETKECYYIYELIMNGRSQTGLVACASIDDYIHNVIKKHENTRENKEVDRIRHVDTCNAQTGPIFLAYRSREEINQIIDEVKQGEALYDFQLSDGIIHHVWVIKEEDKVREIRNAFNGVKSIYIADGHHRAASAVKVGLKRREANPGFLGKEEFNYFLSVLFPEDQLMIMPYNRVIKDLNGNRLSEFIEKVKVHFEVTHLGKQPYAPEDKGCFGMYTAGSWYKLTAHEDIRKNADPVEALDVSILQNYILSNILDIKDPRTDKRIDFIGGIRGLSELEKRANEDMEIAFSMYPTGITELFAVSDAGKLMPPKSTWFEPKLRSGLFIHKLS